MPLIMHLLSAIISQIPAKPLLSPSQLLGLPISLNVQTVEYSNPRSYVLKPALRI